MATADFSHEGGSFIPASQRPDGTWRKQRRVKDGYIPQDEVPLYESKGRQIAARNTNIPVGLTAEIVAEAKAKREAKEKGTRCPIPGLVISVDDKKKKKKKNANTEDVIEAFAKTSLSSSAAAKSKPQQLQQVDPAKRLKNLRKKLREIEILEVKLENDEIPNPEKDQLEKVKNKEQVLSEIAKLEALV
ncbi:partner of Y14 and mago [Arctopsyche grandis]|uniref:partner of Y14 and mago n=1 Tax=Arctopsyche grandis TaxID=121162 RepID=UPI00406D68ED